MTEMMKAYNERLARKARFADLVANEPARKRHVSLRPKSLPPVNRRSTKRVTFVMTGGTFGVPAASERRI